ncbi:MAG: discoidin domain-containing protein [Planctomycetota bacterium]|nr:discoidin domain-containing protein [Planctomycetota bacterium]
MNRDFLACLAIALQCHYAAAVSASAAETPAIVQLSGTDWRIHEDVAGKGAEARLFAADPASPGWIPATVPGNVQADLEAAHQLRPLSYGAGDPRLNDVANKDWWYREDFSIPDSLAGKRLTLVFDGVDKQAEVWLNGRQVGSNSGMFKRFQFDVTTVAKPGQSNQLAVRVARRVGDWNERNPWKSATNLGWDWGTSVATLGIWKDVRLEATGPARIDWTRVQTTLSEDHAKATVIVSLEIDSAAELSAKARFRVSGQGQAVDATVQAALKKGSNRLTAELPLERPALWWPNGQGTQPLYTLVAELHSAEGGGAIDVRSTRFGVRDLRWVPTQDAPADHLCRYQLITNGRPVRTIGSNLVPADLYFGRMAPRVLFLLHQAKAAGINTLRLWGGGVILHDSFYDLADELGIMLVQEFPLANHLPPTDAEYLAMVESTARNIVRQVRNHPAIIEFDGGNEMPWKSDTDHPAFHLLKRVVGEEDGRMFRATCPDLGAGHGPWEFDRKWYGPINETNALVTLHGKEQLLRPTMRQGEFGSHSPAHLEVWQREIPVQDQWPIVGLQNEVLHRKRGVRAIGPYNWLNMNILEDVFGPFDGLRELVEAGQFYGADGVRYMVDAYRRNGSRIGGLTTWMFNEPWPNAAGSYQVDYDGRPKMMHDFMKQAVAPISLSLKYDSPFYPLERGMKVELFLTSDAPQPAADLHWKWLARDRRGTVFARSEGTAAIAPLEVKSLGEVTLTSPAKTVFGPIFMELRLEEAGGKLLTERLHIFGLANLSGPFAQLVKNVGADPDDDASQITTPAERPADLRNQLYLLLGKSMTPPPPNTPPQGRGLLNVNDGYYGNDRGWSDGWFEFKLRGKPTLGRFKFGRDRTGVCTDRCVDYMKIETSLDGETWQTVFEQDKLSQLPGFSPVKTVEIQTNPVQAQYLKVTVMPPNSSGGSFPVIDEFEAYAPSAQTPATLPHVAVLDRPEVWRPMRHTTLEVQAAPARIENEQEVLELTVKNTGPMTAFPCEVHPLISYRTDLLIDNNHCFIPPGEGRTMTIRAASSSPRPLGEGPGERAACGLTLSQTGWWISCWNADNVTVAPGDDVLLVVGRRDQMCREFLGYIDPQKIANLKQTTLVGTRPDPAQLPYLLDAGRRARFEFPLSGFSPQRPARLRIHAADQSKAVRATLNVTVNGKTFEQSLPAGLGIQDADPAHLAFPATVEFEIPAGVLQPGQNVLEVQVSGAGWFTWDALECIADRVEQRSGE